MFSLLAGALYRFFARPQALSRSQFTDRIPGCADALIARDGPIYSIADDGHKANSRSSFRVSQLHRQQLAQMRVQPLLERAMLGWPFVRKVGATH